MTRTPGGPLGPLPIAITIIRYAVDVTYRINYNARRADSGLSPRRTTSTGNLIRTVVGRQAPSRQEAEREIRSVVEAPRAVDNLRRTILANDEEANRSSAVEIVHIQPQILDIQEVVEPSDLQPAKRAQQRAGRAQQRVGQARVDTMGRIDRAFQRGVRRDAIARRQLNRALRRGLRALITRR